MLGHYEVDINLTAIQTVFWLKRGIVADLRGISKLIQQTGILLPAFPGVHEEFQIRKAPEQIHECVTMKVHRNIHSLAAEVVSNLLIFSLYEQKKVLLISSQKILFFLELHRQRFQ